MALDIFGDINKFASTDTDSVMMKTIRLPRKEVDLEKAVKSAAEESLQLNQSIITSRDASVSAVSSLMVNKSKMSQNSKSQQNLAKFDLAHINSMSKLQPRVFNLRKHLKDHRVECHI